MPEHEALFYRSEGDAVHCELCPWHCKIRPEATGRCGVRVNRGGRLLSLNYAEITSAALDPIEKKPLYHYYPGTSILSLGTFGCNLKCGFCQNWQISQKRPPTEILQPEAAVAMAVKYRDRGNIGIAYTYNEPFVWYEYIAATAPLVHAAGMVNVLVTNGIVEQAPLEEVLPYIGAMNVDIKSMSERFYLEHCKGQALPARQTVERAWDKTHIEVTNLLIPGENDSPEETRSLAQWLAGISADIPLHLSAYRPDYEFDRPPTPPVALQRAYDIASEYLNYVYVGNVHIPGTGDTRCPRCSNMIVSRQGFRTRIAGLTTEGRCSGCENEIPIVR